MSSRSVKICELPFILCISASVIVLACTSKEAVSEKPLGDASISIFWDEIGCIATGQWEIFGEDILIRGDIDESLVTDDITHFVSTDIYLPDLQTGKPYTIAVFADVLDQEAEKIGTCEQRATFEIEAGRITTLNIHVRCAVERTAGCPGWNGIATANHCPTIDHLIAHPLSQTVGDEIALAANVEDKDGEAISVLWTASSGTVNNADQTSASYTCTDAGPVDITLTVTDTPVGPEDGEPCEIVETFSLQCMPAKVYGDGGLDAGGA